MTEEQVRKIIRDEFQRNWLSGTPKIPPHTHNSVDNLPVNLKDTVGTISSDRVTDLSTATTLPGGANGDIQINANG